MESSKVHPLVITVKINKILLEFLENENQYLDVRDFFKARPWREMLFSFLP